jgi:glycogen(starch) synthase
LHVLVTTDTLSPVWAYTRELVTGLAHRGARVTLVSFGEIPMPEQTLWMETLRGVEYHPTAFRLDWMQEGQQDFKDSSAYLSALVKELKPDLLHLNHPCYGNLPVAAPRLVVAHGDLISWSRAVHGREPKETPWLRSYRQRLTEGFNAADIVTAPSVWMLDSLRSSYVMPSQSSVVYNGRNPVSFNPYGKKDGSVVAAGRMLDAGQQLELLTRHSHRLPVSIAGSAGATPAPKSFIRTDVKVAVEEAAVSIKGQQTETQMRALYAQSSIYAATARYEPFGAGSIEAAFSRCAIVANDIPLFHELWGDAALYFRANDSASLAATLEDLNQDRELCRTYAHRAFQRAHECFTSKRMTDEYCNLYDRVLANTGTAVAA